MAANSQFAVALHTMAVLAYLGEDYVKSDQIAWSVNTNSVVIRRILQKLSRAKLIETAPGKAGGARLSRPPNAITLREVYQAMEGTGIFAVHRNPENRACNVSSNIKSRLSDVFGRAEAAAGRVLGTVSLSEFIKGFPKPERIKAVDE
jgi:Rrf2 family protein